MAKSDDDEMFIGTSTLKGKADQEYEFVARHNGITFTNIALSAPEFCDGGSVPQGVSAAADPSPTQPVGSNGGANGGAIAAGVLVPIILIALIAAFFVYRRRAATAGASSVESGDKRGAPPPRPDSASVAPSKPAAGHRVKPARPAAPTRPARPPPARSAPKPASAWEAFTDDTSGDVYYFNSETQETTWERPTEFTEC